MDPIVETPEVAEAEVKETTEVIETTEVKETVAELTIEDLLSEDLSQYEEFIEEDGELKPHKGLTPLSDVLQHMVPEGRKHLANLKGLVTKKTQEVARIRKELEAERAKLADERKALYNGAFAESLKELSADPEKPYDVFDEKGMEAKIKQEAARLMQEMLKPIQEQTKEQEAIRKAQEFKADHPDLVSDPEIKLGVYQLLTERENLTLEDAYYLVVGKLGKARVLADAQDKQRSRSARKASLRKTSTGSGSRPAGKPKFKNVWESYQWHKAHQKD